MGPVPLLLPSFAGGLNPLAMASCSHCIPPPSASLASPSDSDLPAASYKDPMDVLPISRSFTYSYLQSPVGTYIIHRFWTRGMNIFGRWAAALFISVPHQQYVFFLHEDSLDSGLSTPPQAALINIPFWSPLYLLRTFLY